jgi:hypothetical protein
LGGGAAGDDFHRARLSAFVVNGNGRGCICCRDRNLLKRERIGRSHFGCGRYGDFLPRKSVELQIARDDRPAVLGNLPAGLKDVRAAAFQLRFHNLLPMTVKSEIPDHGKRLAGKLASGR